MGFCTNIWLIYMALEKKLMTEKREKKIKKKKQNYIQQQQGHT